MGCLPVLCKRITTFLSIRTLLFLGGMVYCLGVKCQDGGFPRLTWLGIENGLSNNNVTSIFQDQHGFMWFGTYDGLNRYDGYQFTVFRNNITDSNSLVNNRINCIQQDRQNNLWIGTGKGACIYNNKDFKWHTIRYPENNKAKKIEFSVHNIAADLEGNMFLATKKGLMLCPQAAPMAENIPLVVNNKGITGYEPVVIECDTTGRVWVLVRNVGLCLYDYGKKSLRLFDAIAGEDGNCLKADQYGNMWIGADNAIYKYNIGTHRFINRRMETRVVSLFINNDSTLWIASDGGGIFTIDTACKHSTQILSKKDNDALSTNAVYVIYQDHEKRKWFATLSGGIVILDPHKQLFKTISRHALGQQPAKADFINSFCIDKTQQIWMGTEGNGVGLWDPVTNHFTDFRKDPRNPGSIHGNAIMNIIEDARGNMWLSEWVNGIDKYNHQTQRFQHYACFNTVTGMEDKFAWALYHDKENNVWASTCNGGGLYIYNNGADKFELFDNGLKDIVVLAEDKAGFLWAGDYAEHLILIDKTTKRHKRFHLGFRVRSIYEDRSGNFWIGTEGGGLLLFDRASGKYTRFTQANGLPGNSILSMLEDNEGNLWMGTYNGITSMNPTARTFKNYTVSDGLQSNQYNYNAALKLASGVLLFGGVKGVDMFDPAIVNKEAKKTSFPRLSLTGLKINNIPIEFNTSFISKQTGGRIEELKISYDRAIVSFDFVALEYAAPDKIDYAYYMQGVDRNWNYIDKKRNASFSQLHEGEYTFNIKSTNGDGHWNPQMLSIHIVVLPPWYRTWLAYILYSALAAGGIIWYLRHMNKRKQLAFEVKLAHMETEKEKELNEKKLSFFTNISHEFRTPLTLIINPVQELLENTPVTSENNGLQIVYRNAKRLLGLVDQLLLFRKAGSENDYINVRRVNFAALCNEVYGYFTQQAKTKNIQYEFNAGSNNMELYIDREKIEIALFNIVSNAMRFTPENGSVSFSVRESEQEIIVDIQDSGPGIEAGNGQRIFEKFYQAKENAPDHKGGFGIGLFLTKYFIEAHKGQIGYETKKGTGTRFFITLQKGKEHFDDNARILETAPDAVMEYAPPLLQEPEPESATVPESTQNASIQLSDKKVLLVVDDNEEIRSYIRQLFQENMHVLEADNGIDGLSLCKKHLPDIVVSDVVMPGMDGVTLCNHIKKDPDLDHIPVILLTVVTSSNVKLQGLEEGADDYIAKPFEKDLFMARVNNILKSRSALRHYFFDKITLKDSQQKVSAEDKQFIESCITLIEENLEKEDFNVSMMTAKIGMSRSNLYRKVKAISGSSINSFIRSIRLRRAAVLLLSTDLNISQVAFQVGINDIKYFRSQFKQVFGVNPSDYVKKYRHVFNKEFQIVPGEG